jgi:hypothetical protein
VTFTCRHNAIGSLNLPPWCLEQWATMCARSDKHHGGFVTIALTLPRRPRTTGPGSQSAHFHGHCQTIAEETGAGFDAVKAHMKRLAVDRGYPFDTLPDGSIAPKSEADASVEDAVLLIETTHQFADEYSIRLVEGDT